MNSGRLRWGRRPDLRAQRETLDSRFAVQLRSVEARGETVGGLARDPLVVLADLGRLAPGKRLDFTLFVAGDVASDPVDESLKALLSFVGHLRPLEAYANRNAG